MEMVLREGGIRDDGLNVDPVSGNEIPSGSLAEEVRDDIPAQLSGGEYVVPADVVRFFGVKYFEDLRMQAKLGLQDMERDGRIGGEPMKEDTFNPYDVEIVDEKGRKMYLGGSVPTGYAPGGYVQDPFARYRIPGLSSSLGMGMPEPITPDITATPTPVVTNPVTAPAVATPDVGQCGEGRMWNGYECVLVRRTGDDDSNTGGGSGGEGGGGSTSNWFEEEDILDINNFVDKQLESIKPETGRADKGFIENIIGSMPAVQMAQGVSKLTNISKARAAVELNQKAGFLTEAEADALDQKINDAARDAGILKAANSLAPGSMRRSAGERRADKFGNKDGETSQEELANWLKSLGVEESAKREQVKKEEAAEAARVEAARQTQLEQARQNQLSNLTYRSDNDDSDSTKTYLGTTSPGSGGYSVNVYQPTNETIRAPSRPSSISRDEDSNKSNSSSYSQTTSNPWGGGGRAKGGLIKKRKKK